MEDYCEGCIHNVLQKVICQTDRGDQVLWEPACIAEKCIKEEENNNGKPRNF